MGILIILNSFYIQGVCTLIWKRYGKSTVYYRGKSTYFPNQETQNSPPKIVNPNQSPRNLLYQLSSIEKYTNKINYHAGFQIFLGPMGPTSD